METIDSVRYAQIAVDKMVEFTGGQGGFVMYVGGLTVPLHNFWADQALTYIAANYPGLRELASRFPVAESVADSRSTTLDLIRTYGDELKAVIGWGSLGPIGAAQAVQEIGFQDRVVVGGSATPLSAAPYLADGSLDWAQLWDPADAGYAMVAVAKLLIEGQTLATGTELPGLGPVTLGGEGGKVISVDQTRVFNSVADTEGFSF